MDFGTWTQMSESDKKEYFKNTDPDKIIAFLDKVCESNYDKSVQILSRIQENRLLRAENMSLSMSIPDLNQIQKNAMRRMCEICEHKLKDIDKG